VDSIPTLNIVLESLSNKERKSCTVQMSLEFLTIFIKNVTVKPLSSLEFKDGFVLKDGNG